MATSRTGTGKWKNIRIRLLADAAHEGRPCPECQKPFEWEISKHPRSPEIDHIHPIARGGTDDRANLRVICRRCNQSRGARPTPTRKSSGMPPVVASPIW